MRIILMLWFLIQRDHGKNRGIKQKEVLILVGRKEKSVFPILQIVYLINRFSL